MWFIFQPKVQNLEDQDFSLGSRLKTKRRRRRAMLFFPPSLPSFSSLFFMLFFLLLFWPFPLHFFCFFGLATGPGSRLFQPTISGLHWPELHPCQGSWTAKDELPRSEILEPSSCCFSLNNSGRASSGVAPGGIEAKIT